MGNADEIQTPKGLFATRDVGAHMSYFIANYKGGRNESFMYGCDEETKWFDYDLVSAYTTGMVNMNLPDYYNASLINENELSQLTTEQLLNGYLILNALFIFDSNVKYPSIPCYIDKTSTVYPLSGECYLTGPEYILALKQGVKFTFKSAFYIHPKVKLDPVKNEVVYMKPFHGIINKLQSMRREFPKGTVNNMLYKELGNGIYGNLVKGLSNKKEFDSITGEMLRVKGSSISNPILASWTTAFIRSVIGECLHNIHKLGGRVVSVTTDGFLTDIENLEEKLLMLPTEDTTLLRLYRELRVELTTKRNLETGGIDSQSSQPDALEIKTFGKGVITWATRGQIGIEGSNIAATGFQKRDYEKDEMVTIFKKILSSDHKEIEYTHFSLRSARDIYDKGGCVVSKYKDQKFRLLFDNRREIVSGDVSTFVQIGGKSKKLLTGYDLNPNDMSNRIVDSKPLRDINHCKTLRFISKFPNTLPFNKYNANRNKSLYKSKVEVAVRNFVKAYYSTNEKFGLFGNEFRYVKDMISFIYDCKSTQGIRISQQSISNLKGRQLIWRPVMDSNETREFVQHIKLRFPYFNDDLFFKRFLPKMDLLKKDKIGIGISNL